MVDREVAFYSAESQRLVGGLSEVATALTADLVRARS